MSSPPTAISPPSRPRVILAINGGSSSIKYAGFAADGGNRRIASGQIERIGSGAAQLVVHSTDGSTAKVIALGAMTFAAAVEFLVGHIRSQFGAQAVAGIGHRVVHGGTQLVDHQLVTATVIERLREARPFDLTHLPAEIALIEAFGAAFPAIGQVACFDTVFHHDMPDVAKRFAIPRRYFEQGIYRYGFHGLSYTYLMQQLTDLDPAAATGRVILAHLGSGASMAAVFGGKPMDTTMGFTPAGGLVMGTRCGDLDPGVLSYVARTEGLSGEQLDEFISHQCGLLGVSASSADIRDLIAKRPSDARANQAIELFCYQSRKYIGSYFAALGGLDTLVFSGGIGQHSAAVRAEICQNLAGLGIEIDSEKNASNGPVISRTGSKVTVRVIATDEEQIVADLVQRLAVPPVH